MTKKEIKQLVKSNSYKVKYNNGMVGYELSKPELNDVAEEIVKKFDLCAVSQAEQTVCSDCGDFGWIYRENKQSRQICSCHY